MFAHYERAKDREGNYLKFGNECIDKSRTHLNYNLAPKRKVSQGEFVRSRCSEVKCQKRKDVNVMCSWVVTAPKDLPKEEHEEFFKASYDFLQKRYGKENVVSAYVHMDETTPHIHFAFVPVVPDKKKGGLKVSAKECITRKDLQTFHGDLERHLEHVMGHRVNILNEATKDGNKTIEELKRGEAIEKVKKLKLDVAVMERRVRSFQNMEKLKKAILEELDGEISQKEDQIKKKGGEVNGLSARIHKLKNEYAELEARPPKVREVVRHVNVEVPVEVPVEVNYKKAFQDALEAFRLLDDWVRKKGMSQDAWDDLKGNLEYLRTCKTLYPRSKSRVAPLHPESNPEQIRRSDKKQ